MGTYVTRRLLMLIPMLVGITFVSYGMLHLAPGDMALAVIRSRGTVQMNMGQVEEMRAELGLNDPFFVQYGRWLWQVLQLDFGLSLRSGKPVAELFATGLPATIQLASVSLLLAGLTAVPIGILSAVKQHTPIDHGGRVFALVGASMPSFWLGLLLMYVFAVRLDWLPALGHDSPRHIVLPALTLSLVIAPTYARLLRACMLEILCKPYITAARAKGVTERAVILRHALRNALIPIVTVFGLSFAHLLGGAVIVETIFVWPGIGKLMVDAIQNRDFPIIQAFVLIAATLFVLTSLAVDISYRWLDPRIRLGSESR